MSPQITAGATAVPHTPAVDSLSAPKNAGLSSSAPERTSMEEWSEVCVLY